MTERTVWAQGVVVGMIGAVTVAAWFFLLDLARGQPLLTPATLGSAILLGARDLAQVEVTAPVILGYSLLHLAAFAALGILISFVIRRVRTRPPLILGAILVFVVLQALFLGLLTIAAEGVLLGVMAWWAIGIGNLLAAVTMGYYVWEKDPALQEAVAREPFDRSH